MNSVFYKLIPSEKELHTIQNSITSELINASLHKKSSIPFIRHEIPTQTLVKPGELFQVMTIGGSVFKTALVKKEKESCMIIQEDTDSIPIFTTEDTFLTYLTSHLDPRVAYVGMNLAYPLAPVTNNTLLDGTLLRGTKEHRFTGLVGKQVGLRIAQYVNEKFHKTILVTVANDTVCLFLSEVTKSTWKNTVVGIIGTGTNYAFGLQNQIVNLECGGFDKFIQTSSGKQVDAGSVNPGHQMIEKEIAGAYLHHHFNILAKEYNIQKTISSTKELSDLAKKNDGDASKLAQTLLRRSAGFSACIITGIYNFKTNLTDSTDLSAETLAKEDSTHVTFVMEGSLFWEGYFYKKCIEEYLQKLGMDNKILFAQKAHHSIKGAIKLLTGLS